MTMTTETAPPETKPTGTPPPAGDPPKTMSVDLDGIKLDLPTDQAKAIIQRRDAAKAQHRQMEERLAAVEADAAAKAAAAARAEEAAALAAAEKAKDVDAIKAHLTKAHATEMEKAIKALSTARERQAAADLRQAVTKVPTVRPESAALVSEILATRYKLTLDDAGALAVTARDGSTPRGPDGSPLTLEGLAAAFLASDEAAVFRKPGTPQGSGAGGGGGGSVPGLTRSALSKDPKAASAFITAHGAAAFQSLPA